MPNAMRNRKAPWFLSALMGVLFLPPINETTHFAAAYLKEAQRPSGLFRYEYDFVREMESPRDNIVRQAGTGYALGEYYVHTRDESVRKTIILALRAYSARSIPAGKGRLVSGDGKAGGARAGATALALLTELQYAKASGDGRFEKERNQWLRGLLALHRPGGGFRKAPGAKIESDYYNGEIWLALGYYDRFFAGRADVGKVLKEVDAHFLARYSAAPTVKFYHWGAMAALQRYEASREKRFARFAVRQTIAFLDRLNPRLKEHVNTCYAAEGLISAYALREAGEMSTGVRDRLLRRIHAEMRKNREFQIQLFQWILPVKKRFYMFSGRLPDFVGAFVNNSYWPKTRIDHTQHCLSAFIKYEKYGLEQSD